MAEKVRAKTKVPRRVWSTWSRMLTVVTFCILVALLVQGHWIWAAWYAVGYFIATFHSAITELEKEAP